MAECISVDLENTEQLSVHSRSLECPICLEQFRQPKSLPCLHSFCQDCLTSYIVKELSGELGPPTSFSCPVCRKTTQPISQSEDVPVWAQQFPTNSLAVELLESQQQKSQHAHCTPCKKKENTDVPAEFWCKTNKTFFCRSCKTNFHDYVHTECNVIELKDGTVPLLNKETELERCGTHKKKIDYYCEEHDLLGCSKCIIVDHRRCEAVTTTEDYVRKLKTNSRMENMITALKEGLKAMKSLVIDFNQQTESLAKDREVAVKNITDLRESIDRRLDKMQQEVTADLMTKIKEIKHDFETSSNQCERLSVALQNTLELSESAVHKECHMETILMFQRGQAEILACKGVLEEMKKSFTSVNVKHDIRPHVTTDSMNSVLDIGNIVVHKNPRKLPFVLKGKEFAPLAERGVREIAKINIKRPSDDEDCISCGVVYLPGGLLIVSDTENSKLKLFSEKGDYVDELKLPGSPFGMCLIDNSTAAVVTQSPNAVRLAKVESSKLAMSSEISCPDGECLGIAYADNHYFLTIDCDVHRMKTDGQTKIIHQSSNTCYSLAYDQKKQHLVSSHFSSDIDDIAVTKLAGDEVTDLLNVGIVEGAAGVAMDKESNVYVCGYSSNNVIQMSSDGANVRELLTSTDGIHTPSAISVCDEKFVITNESGTQRNFIHLFEFI